MYVVGVVDFDDFVYVFQYVVEGFVGIVFEDCVCFFFFVGIGNFGEFFVDFQIGGEVFGEFFVGEFFFCF